MAGGGGAPNGRAPPAVSQPRASFARVVAGDQKSRVFGNDVVNTRENFDRLKTLSHPRFKPDANFRNRASIRMQSVMYGKFLGRSLPLDQVRIALKNLWKDLGDFAVSDLPNGFYYIRFQDREMAEYALWNGPWTIQGMVLQLIPWREKFQPAFERLDTAAVWIQLHHLPMEFWEADTLESLASVLGNVLKIDEHTLNVDIPSNSEGRSRYARLCVEIDLSQPLERAIWVGEGEEESLAVVLYEKIPTFCFRCGRLGHIIDSCSLPPSSTPVREEGSCSHAEGGGEDFQKMQLDEMRQGEEDAVKQGGSEAVGSTKEGNNPYGIWQTAGPRRGWGWGRRTEKPSGNSERNPKTDTCSEEITDGQQIFKHAGRHATRGGRGGRMGGGNLGGRGITSRDGGNTRYEALRMVDENLITDNPNREIVPSKQSTRERGETHTLVPKVLHIPVEPNLTKIPESRPLINLPVDPGEGAMVVAGNSQFPRLSPPRLITSLAGSNQAQAQSQAPRGMLDDDHERLVDRVSKVINTDNNLQPDQDMFDPPPDRGKNRASYDEDMPLAQLQKEIRIESLAKRAKFKDNTCPTEGVHRIPEQSEELKP